jgi:stage IV sporulation protein A
MELMVLPQITNPYKRERAVDELPQSGSGRTIMTAEPKFVPEESVELKLNSGGSCRIRMIDCVGYLVDGALGTEEDTQPRLLSTPWHEEPIPMALAAEIGTQKVINDHSTIGLVVTTDGTFSGISRENYLPAEKRVIQELQSIGKPFLTLVNSSDPNGPSAVQVCEELKEKYGIRAFPIYCIHMTENDLHSLLNEVLYEFPVREILFHIPSYIHALEPEHTLRQNIFSSIKKYTDCIEIMRHTLNLHQSLSDEKTWVQNASIASVDLGNGIVEIRIDLPSEIFYQIITQKSGVAISGDDELITALSEMSEKVHEYERISGALQQAMATGYGVMMPQIEELTLESPEIIKQGGRYGVKLCASAASIHLIKTDIKASITPIVGTEKQSEELVHYLLGEFDQEPYRIWETNIFGKPLSELVNEELSNKLARMPDDARNKFRETLEKIINETTGGLICILL